jgi:hypothetical protein
MCPVRSVTYGSGRSSNYRKGSSELISSLAGDIARCFLKNSQNLPILTTAVDSPILRGLGWERHTESPSCVPETLRGWLRKRSGVTSGIFDVISHILGHDSLDVTADYAQVSTRLMMKKRRCEDRHKRVSAGPRFRV